MSLPFTLDQFLDVFRRYNFAVWPAQWILLALGVVAVALAIYDRGAARRWVSGILAALWLWMAVAYHWAFFASINRVAVVFAVAFAIQGALFVWIAFRWPAVSYRPPSTIATILGAILVAYALVVYPAIGYVVGHRYPATPTFGVPCPTTIFTVALLVWASPGLPRRVLIVPLLWSLVGTSAALTLGMVEDFGLFVAAVAAVIWIPLRRRAVPNAPIVATAGAHNA
jgi:hypothetical protein